MYNSFGAHCDQVDGVSGTRFAVWAPNATEVSVVCDRNEWAAGRDTLLPSDSGVWRGFVPGVAPGDAYQYGIRTKTGDSLQKADPFAFHAECPPKSASIVCDLDGFEWQDSDWVQRRSETNWLERPMSIY